MTETDAKSVEHTRFVRELRKLIPAGLLAPIAIEAIARGLWDTFITRFMPTNAPRGDVGRFTNADIAEGVGWHGDADQFVEAMITAGRLAHDPEHRLVVVDWHRLAPAYLRSNVKHAGGFIAPGAQRYGHPNGDRNEDRNEDRNGECNEATNGGLSPPVYSSLSSPSLPSSSTTWSRAEREEVEGELLNCGVRLAESAVAKAIQNGCTRAAVMACIAYWRCMKPAWDEGGLKNRIGVLRPDQDHTTLWPDPSEAYVRGTSAGSANKAVFECTEDNARRRESKASITQLLDELHSTHWPTIEAMDATELRKLWDETYESDSSYLWNLRGQREINATQQRDLAQAYQRRLELAGAAA